MVGTYSITSTLTSTAVSSTTSTDSAPMGNSNGILTQSTPISDTGGVSYEDKMEDYNKSERMLRIEEKEELMDGWLKRKPDLKKILLRSDVQLRGICFGGRGWA